MIKNIKLQKLHSKGFSHILIVVAIVVGVGVAGAYSLVASHADSSRKNQRLAQKILEQANNGHIDFVSATGNAKFDQADAQYGSTPRDNLRSAADGRQSNTTRNCDGRGGYAGSLTDTYIDGRILLFIYRLSKEKNIAVTSIVGQCHDSSTSTHYKGNAVDLACRDAKGNDVMSRSILKAANDIGKKVGVKHNGENCKNAGHYHFSIHGE